MTARRKQSRAQRAAIILVCVLFSFTLAVLIALRCFHLPQPTGPYPVGTAILYFADASRHEAGSSDPSAKRELVVQLWYPAQATQKRLATYQRRSETTPQTFYDALLRTNSRVNAPIANAAPAFPVLLSGHRWGGQRTQNTALAEDLASHGYVVVAVDHPYNSSRVQLASGQVIRGDQDINGPNGDRATAAERIAFWNQTLEVWAADDRFVLDQLAAANANPHSPYFARLGTNHAGAFGHSFGGAVALRLCGLDPRIRAAVNLDGWTFGALASRTSAQPVMVLYEQVALDRERELQAFPQREASSTVQDELDQANIAAVTTNLNQNGGIRLYVRGTQHLDFTDQPLLPPLRRMSYTGPIAGGRANQIVRDAVLSFFDQSLRGQPSPWLDAPQIRYPEVSNGR